MNEPLKIDMHTHIIPESLPDFADKFGYEGFIYLDHHKPGFARMMQGDKFFREIAENCWNPELRIEEYSQKGVQVQVICTIPVLFSYWAKANDGLTVSRFLNDHIAGIVQKYPKNYIGLGNVPLQDLDFAVEELERCKELGFPGVQIGSNLDNRNLSSLYFFPFFEAAQELDMAILIHPWNMLGTKEMSRYWLPWLVGMPAETTRAICSLIFGGVMKKYPKLRFAFAHAGGTFFSTIGRIEHGFNCRPDLVAVDNEVNPKEYFNHFWIDSITHDAHLLEYLLKTVDSKKICLGSDYPFPLGDLEIGAYIEKMELDESIKQDIFHNATAEWLKLDLKNYKL